MLAVRKAHDEHQAQGLTLAMVSGTAITWEMLKALQALGQNAAGAGTSITASLMGAITGLPKTIMAAASGPSVQAYLSVVVSSPAAASHA